MALIPKDIHIHIHLDGKIIVEHIDSPAQLTPAQLKVLTDLKEKAEANDAAVAKALEENK